MPEGITNVKEFIVECRFKYVLEQNQIFCSTNIAGSACIRDVNESLLMILNREPNTAQNPGQANFRLYMLSFGNSSNFAKTIGSACTVVMQKYYRLRKVIPMNTPNPPQLTSVNDNQAACVICNILFKAIPNGTMSGFGSRGKFFHLSNDPSTDYNLKLKILEYYCGEQIEVIGSCLLLSFQGHSK